MRSKLKSKRIRGVNTISQNGSVCYVFIDGTYRGWGYFKEIPQLKSIIVFYDVLVRLQNIVYCVVDSKIKAFNNKKRAKVCLFYYSEANTPVIG